MANFPTSVSTNANLYIAVNGLQTTLAVSILSTDTTIQLASTTSFPTTGLVTIDNGEVVSYTGISGANLTGCTRGADGTTAAAHNAGVAVGATIVAAHHNLSKDEIIAIETALGAGFAKGNLTAGSVKVSVTSGTGAVIGSGTTVDIGTFNLGDLSNVVLTSPANNDLLAFNSGSGKWVNISSPAASLPLTGGTMTGDIVMSNQTGIIFKEPTGAGSGAVTVRAADSGVTSYTIKLPPTVASAGQVLEDVAGNGVLSWQTPSGSGTVNPGTAGEFAYYPSSTNVVSPFTGATIAQLFSYRRPNIVYRSGTVADIETGLDGTSGDVTVLFPDGVFRTDSDTTRIRMTISQNAVFNNATRANNIGGLDSGSVGNNNWYAMYAVKVTAGSGAATDFVAVASLTLPLQANYATLNSNFGTNGWVYLGLIRYGDQTGNNVILRFIQAGHLTLFGNTTNGQVRSASGVLLADSSGTTTLTYTYAAGTGTTNIPDNIQFAVFTGSKNSGSAGNEVDFQEAAGNLYFGTLPANGDSLVYRWTSLAFQGARVVGNAGAGAASIWISGFTDSALGIGTNPLL